MGEAETTSWSGQFEIWFKSKLVGIEFHEQLRCSTLMRSLFLHLYLNTIKGFSETRTSFAVTAPEVDYIMLLQQFRDSDLVKVVLVVSHDSNGPPKSHVQHLEQNGPQLHLVTY